MLYLKLGERRTCYVRRGHARVPLRVVVQQRGPVASRVDVHARVLAAGAQQREMRDEPKGRKSE